MKFKQFNIFISLMFIALTGFALTPEVLFHETVLLEQTLDEPINVRIGDLANIKNISDAYLEREIAFTPLFKIQDSKMISDQDLLEKLKLVDLKKAWQERIGGKQISLILPKNINLKVKKHLFTSEALKSEITENFKSRNPNVNLQIKDLTMPAIDVSQIRNWKIRNSDQQIKAAFSLPIDATLIDGSKKTLWVVGYAQRTQTVAVATRALSAGETMNENDIKMSEEDVTFATDVSLTENHLKGATAGRNIAAGQIIWKNMIRPQLAAKFGETIQVVYSGSDFEIASDAIAQSQGFIGDVIKVKMGKNQKIISARLTARGVVELQ